MSSRWRESGSSDSCWDCISVLFMFMMPSFCHQPEYQDPSRLLLAYEQQAEQRAGILASPARQPAPFWMALGPRSITDPLPIQSRLQEYREITLLQHTSPCCFSPSPPSCCSALSSSARGRMQLGGCLISLLHCCLNPVRRMHKVGGLWRPDRTWRPELLPKYK